MRLAVQTRFLKKQQIIRAFTLIELLAVVAILAVIAGAAIYYVAGYVADSRTIVAKQNLVTLNDALTRYKTEGGDIKNLTVGASIGRVLRELQTPTNWAGTTHQFLKTGYTYPARSLVAVGNKHQYHFYGYGGYRSETPAADTPTSTYPYGQGKAYMAKASSGSWSIRVNSSSGVVCFEDQSGNKNYRAVTTTASSTTTVSDLPAASSYTVWACAGRTDNTHGDSTPTGSVINLFCYSNQLTKINVAGLSSLQNLDCDSNQLTNINVSGISSLQSLLCNSNQLTKIDISGLFNLRTLRCDYNQLSSLNVAGLVNLQQLLCNNNQLTSLNVSGCASLQSLQCNSNLLTSLNVSDCTSLLSFYCYSNQLTSLNVSGFSSLQILSCYSNQLTSITLSTSNANLILLKVYNNSALVGSTAAIDSFFATLPNLSGGGGNYLYLGTGSPSATDSTATAKGWTIYRTN